MKEKLQEFALIAEIISSVAILATLIVLVLEMRNNTQVVQASNMQALSERTSQFTITLAENHQLAEIGARFNSTSANAEQLQSSAFLATVLKIGEEAFVQYEAGFLNEEYWESRATFVFIFLGSELGRQTWSNMKKESFIPKYVEYLNSRLQNTESNEN